MPELPKLPTTNGLFTWIKTRAIKPLTELIKKSDGTIKIYDDGNYVWIYVYGGIENSPVPAIGFQKNGETLILGRRVVSGYGLSYKDTLTYRNMLPAYDNNTTCNCGTTASRWHEGHFGTGGIYSDSKITVNSAIVFNLPRQSSPPSNPATDDIYFDDGTNTADGKPHLRAWNGTAWEDL